MKFFTKSKTKSNPEINSSQITTKTECEHKFQDFPWYIESNIITGNYQNQNRLTYRIIEPYVCIYCGKRQDVVLEQREISGYSKSSMQAILDKVQETYYERIKPKPIVEDMINDLKMVDVEHLKWYHYLAGTKDPSTSRDSSINKKIKLKL